MGAMSSSVYNQRMVHVFCLKGQFPEMLVRLRKKQAREGLTELELDNDASIHSHSQINTIRNRARDWEQDWANQPRAHRPARLEKGRRISGAQSCAPMSSNTAHAGGDDWGKLWVWIWVCVCAQLSSVTYLVGWQWRPQPTATRVVFKTDLVEFSLPGEEGAKADEAEVAHAAVNEADEVEVAHDAVCKPNRYLSQCDRAHVVGSSFCPAEEKYRRRFSPCAVLVDTGDTRFSQSTALRKIIQTDLNCWRHERQHASF